MDFREYQTQAKKTDQVPNKAENGIIIPLLGLVGEAGELLSEYKKYLRDGESHKLFKERVAEELGDLLWYIANVSSKFDLDLEKIAESNLQKCHDRWRSEDSGMKGVYIFDHNFPKSQRLPRQFKVEFMEVIENNLLPKMKAFINGKQIGNDLTDNSYSTDGYRFHDIFHFSYAAVLGWSPVLRSTFKINDVNCKRKNDLQKDEVEDGGRAIAIEEGISALVFSYAKDHNYLDGISAIDYQLLKTIKNMTEHLEVSKCGLGDWQQAIIDGYNVWRQVNQHKGGRIIVDLDERSIVYQGK